METILLALILACELTRLYLTHRKMTKRRHFKDKIQGVTRMIWDQEFKAHKTNETREGIRKEYDMLKSRLAATEEKLKDGPPKDEKELGDYKRIEDQKVLIEADMKKHEDQMARDYAEVYGIKPCKDYPEGVPGIMDQIESLEELKAMLKEWDKTL